MSAEPTSLAPRVTAYADAVLERTGLLRNPYLRALGDGSMSLEHFRESQQDFFWAVRYFPRPMAALLSRIPDPADRLDILHNVVEEHGDFRPEQFHANSFAAFLDSIGGRGLEKHESPPPHVHSFNNVLMATCLQDELETAIGCLGVIEYAFANISSQIGRSVVERAWVEAPRLVHYTLHAALDLRHAEEFFALVEGGWGSDRQRHIRSGIDLGAYVFNQLFLGMRAV